MHLTSHQTTHLNAFPARDSAIKGSFTDRGPPLTSHQTTHLNAFPARNLRFSSVSWRPHEALNFIFRVFATCYITICIFNESYLQPIPVPAQYVYMFNILSSKVTCSQHQYQQNMYLQWCQPNMYLQPVPVPAQGTCNQGTFSGTRKGWRPHSAKALSHRIVAHLRFWYYNFFDILIFYFILFLLYFVSQDCRPPTVLVL